MDYAPDELEQLEQLEELVAILEAEADGGMVDRARLPNSGTSNSQRAAATMITTSAGSGNVGAVCLRPRLFNPSH